MTPLAKRPGSAEPESLQLIDDLVVLQSSSEQYWKLPLADVAVIGEFTNSDGPYLPDYFLVFVDWQGARYDCSVYADNAIGVLQPIFEKLGCEPTASLAASTEFASLVHWPQHLSGRELFRLDECPRRWWARLLLGPQYYMHLAPAVAEFVQRGRDAAAEKPAG